MQYKTRFRNFHFSEIVIFFSGRRLQLAKREHSVEEKGENCYFRNFGFLNILVLHHRSDSQDNSENVQKLRERGVPRKGMT